MRQKKRGGEMKVTLTLTADEFYLLKSMAKSHIDKLEQNIETERELEKLFGAEETTPRIKRLEAEIEKTNVLSEKIEKGEQK